MLPDILNPNAPANTDDINLGPAVIRAIAQFVADVFGVPVSPTAVTGQALSITAGGIVTIAQPGGMVVADPTQPLGIASKQYVDAKSQAASIPAATVSNGGSGTVYSGSTSPSVAAYVANQLYILQFVQTIPQGGSPVTVNLNGLGAVTVKKGGNFATSLFDVGQGDIPANGFVLVVYDGTFFQLYGGGANAAAISGWPTANKTQAVSPFAPIAPSNGDTWVYNSSLGAFIPGAPGSGAGGYLSIGVPSQSINTGALATLATLSLTAPATGGPFRIKTGYFVAIAQGNNDGQNDFQVTDGTNIMALASVGVTGGKHSGATAFDFSPTTYANAATVTLQLQGRGASGVGTPVTMVGGNSNVAALASQFKAIFEPSN